MTDRKPLVSAEELEALIESWGENRDAKFDRFFPIRALVIGVMCLLFAYLHLFQGEWVANHLAQPGTDLAGLERLIFFKGIFALTLILIGIHSYVRNWHPGVTFSILFVVGLANFVYDLFGLYAAILHDPSPRITLVILGRLLVLWFLFVCVRN